MLDSVHFRPLLPPAQGASADAASAYSTRTLSLLDALLSGPRESREKTYSIPLGTHQYSKESMLVDGKSVRDFPRLQFGGTHLPGTQNTFGGNSTAEFGALLQSVYPGNGFVPLFRYNNFRRILNSNPCPS